MLDKLDRLVDELGDLHSQLILLIGAPGSGKTRLLRGLAERRATRVVGVGAELGRQLLPIPMGRRGFSAQELLRKLAGSAATNDLVLMDNIELMFDQTLRLRPLDLLKREAHGRRVVAAWPGTRVNERLYYGDIGHPERQEDGIRGVVPFELG